MFSAYLSQEDYSNLQTLEQRFIKVIGFLQNAATGSSARKPSYQAADSCKGCSGNQKLAMDAPGRSLEASLKRLRLVSSFILPNLIRLHYVCSQDGDEAIPCKVRRVRAGEGPSTHSQCPFKPEVSRRSHTRCPRNCRRWRSAGVW